MAVEDVQPSGPDQRERQASRLAAATIAIQPAQCRTMAPCPTPCPTGWPTSSASIHAPSPWAWSECARSPGAWGWRAPHGRSSPSAAQTRSEEHTSELQSLMRISSAVFCLNKKKQKDYTD